MIEVDKALDELKRRRLEAARQVRLARSTTRPDEFNIRRLEGLEFAIAQKHSLLSSLQREVKELERAVSFKMMSRYPQNQPLRTEWKRDLTRVKRRMNGLAGVYQPKEKPKPRFASA